MELSHKDFFEGLIGERIGGRYVVERLLGSGGMGLVAAGRYPELEQEVAIKFMRPEYAAISVLAARFLREARLAARVRSPHFVRVFDFGKLDSGVPYLVMEMLHGRDLHDELDLRGALPIPEAVDILLQAALGLAEVHALGVVHRDLKPSNLFLAEAGGLRTVKVLDFGVSKESAREKSDLTSTGNVVGTPQYMAPEQIRESKSTDARADVWSLGVILYELLTRRLPFGSHGDPAGEVYGRILHTDPVPPRHVKPELPPELEETVLKCLLREPGERYRDVGELADGLRPFASPAALARIDAIHRALAAARPIDADTSGKVPAAEAQIVIASQPAATVESSPAAKRPRTPSDQRLTEDYVAPVAPAATPAAKVATPRAETGMTATRSSDAPMKRSSRRVLLPVGAAVIALAAAAIGVRAASKPGPASSASSSPPAPPEPASSSPSLATREPLAPAAPASAPPAIATPAASAPPAASASATASAPAPPRPPTPHPRPRATAAPTSDSIFDRK